ncbi:MAG: pyridoxamine 5'-phosphate oxidase family protein [Dehalococcoidia bacterium]
MQRHEILRYAASLVSAQPGGALATTHAETGNPYITYVLAHLCADGRVLFGSGLARQHSRNVIASPPVSFLFDSRAAVATDWSEFDRLTVEGLAAVVAKEHEAYASLLGQLAAKSPMAAYFTRHGELFCIDALRITLSRGLDPTRYVVDFPAPA